MSTQVADSGGRNTPLWVLLAAALDALPDTADGIATALASEGIRGTPACPERCPLAWWLRGRLGPEARVEVGFWVVAFSDAQPDGVALETPPAVKAFLSRFDKATEDRVEDDYALTPAQEWPELVAS